MNPHLEEITNLAERYGACAALAAGGALIISFADKLIFGPLLPQIVGYILVVIASSLAGYFGNGFVRDYQTRGKIKLLFAMLLNMFLGLAGVYFVAAAVYAAKASVAA